MPFMMHSSDQDADDRAAVDDKAVVDGEATVDVVTEKLENRSRRICASIVVPRSAEQVWQVLTDYDALAEFIPNLTHSRCLEKSDQGIRLEQIGAQCFLNIQFCARVVLNMVEQFPHRLTFEMVEGDFRNFTGAWSLETVETEVGPVTRLCYEVTVVPPRAIPAALIERHLRRDLAQNMQAIRQQAMVAFA
jgi:ribosome-associated toxin RatA of RatAB toxin-antitoxin module